MAPKTDLFIRRPDEIRYEHLVPMQGFDTVRLLLWVRKMWQTGCSLVDGSIVIDRGDHDETIQVQDILVDASLLSLISNQD